MKTSFLILTLALAGCVIDTVPLPEVTPQENFRADDRGAGIAINALFWTDAPALLVGSERSVPGLVTVTVVNPDRSHWQGTAKSAENGSFNLPINAALGDYIEVTILAGDTALDTVTLPLEPASVAANEATTDIVAAIDDFFSGLDTGAVSVGTPDEGSIVSVVGPAGVVSQGIGVVVANLDRGSSTVALANPDGSFHARLVAQSGDELAIFAIEPASSRGGTTPHQVFVP